MFNIAYYWDLLGLVAAMIHYENTSILLFDFCVTLFNFNSFHTNWSPVIEPFIQGGDKHYVREFVGSDVLISSELL